MKEFLRSNVKTLLNFLLVWHTIVFLGSLFLIWQIWQITPPDQAPWVKPVGIAIVALIGITGIIALPYIFKRKSAGRILSICFNYILFIILFLVTAHVLGIFTGIDVLADTFGNGILFLLLAIFGYFLVAISDNYRQKPKLEYLFSITGKLFIITFGIIFLWKLQFLPWAVTVLARIPASPLNLAVTIALFVTGIFIWLLNQTVFVEVFGTTTFHDEAINGFIFISPNLVGFLLFFAFPLLLSFFVSLTDWDAFGTKNWVGLSNYQEILDLDFKLLSSPDQPVGEALDITRYDELDRFRLFGNDIIIGAQDKQFWIALINTIVFSLLAIPLSVVPAVLLANVLNSKLPGIKIFRVIYFIPSIAAVVGVALIWQWLYNAAIGFINYGITLAVGFLNNLPFLSLVDPKIQWLSDSDTALIAIVIMFAWQTVGFNTILYLAGLQSIPKELHEAATVDGAGIWARFWNITLPQLAPTTFFVVSTTTINALKVFEQVFIATNPPGGPNNSTLTVVLYIYQSGFQRFKQGYASAAAWILVIIIFTVTLLQYRRQQKAEESFK